MAQARLKTRYIEEIRPALMQRFGYSTPMQAPRISKVTVNMGVGDAKQDSKMLDAAGEQLATITGQRPSVRRARKSIAQFKVREGMPVGVAVTLRHERSYEFLDRLMSVAIPRIRDFRGLNPRAFDGRGNYSLGVREQIIFPRSTTTRSIRSAASTSLSRRRRPATRKRSRCSWRSVCRSHATAASRRQQRLRGAHGKAFTARPPAADTQVQDPRLHPLSPLWSRPRRIPQVRHLPDLPARARAQRLHPRDDEVELVTRCR